jgi:hypothetical protein
MSEKFIKESDGYISGHADNWLLSVNNIGPNKVVSLSLIKYVAKHTVDENGVPSGPVINTNEVLATFSLNEPVARELSEVMQRLLDDYIVDPQFSK